MAITPISKLFINADKFCDYVPFFSTVSNLINLFQKCVLACVSNRTISKSHYYTYLNEKSFSRCILLSIPFLNLLISVFTSSNRKPEPELGKEGEQFERDTALNLLYEFPGAFGEVEPKFRLDKNFVYEAILKNPNVLEHVDKELLKDQAFLLKISRIIPEALGFADPELLKDETFMTQAIETNPWGLEYGSDSIKDNEKIVLSAVKKCGVVIRFGSDRCRKIHAIIIAALKNTTRALFYLDPDIRPKYDYTTDAPAYKVDEEADLFPSSI